MGARIENSARVGNWSQREDKRNPNPLWDTGRDAWFPTVCGIGLQVILLKSQWIVPQLLEDTKTYKQLTLEPENNK